MTRHPLPQPTFGLATWLGVITALIVFACHLENPSAPDDTFSFPTLKEKISDADYVTIALKDSAGKVVDVLYEGPVTASTSFQDLKAEHYEGGKVFIHIEAKRGEEVVYKTIRGYDPANGGDQERIVYVSPPEKPRDSLRLEPDTVYLALRGPTGRFSALFIPASALREVEWSSLDAGLLDVAVDGRLTARSEGLARVVATTRTAPFLADTAHVRIQAALQVDSVRFEKRLLDLFVDGAAESLAVRVYPPLAPPGVVLSVRDSTLVRIAGSSAQGLKEGETWLLAQSSDNPQKRDSIPVTVFPPEQVDSVRLEQDSLRLYVNGEARSLTARLFPTTLKPRFTWKSESEAVATVDAVGKVSPAGPGKTWVVVQARADSSRKDQVLVIVKQDLPRPVVGGDTVIASGTTLTFHPVVHQEYGTVTVFKWDLDGNGIYEDSSATIPGDLSHAYGQAQVYSVRFYVRDSEGNDTVHVRLVKAVNSRVVQILSPQNGSFTKEGAVDVTWAVDGISQTTTEVLRMGANLIVRSAQDSARNVYSDTVFVHLDQTAPPHPLVQGPKAPINTLTPRWTWASADTGKTPGRGIGTYRFRVDDPNLSAAVSTTDTFYTAATNLSGGIHTLYVQERDEAGNWSPSGSHAVAIDTTAPPAPVLSVSPESPTNNPRPTWNWSGGTGDSLRYYRFKLDNSDFRAGARDTMASQFRPLTELVEGVHTLYLQERDSAGNWSATASRAIIVDQTPPSPPVVSVGPAALTNDATPTWTWTTATPGTVTFRYRLDNTNLEVSATETTVKEFTPGAALMEGVHTLYVQERDAAGNWSSTAPRQVRIDSTPPGPPRIDSTPYSPLNSLRPKWTWKGGVGGARVYRARVDTASLAGATERTDSSFALAWDLAEGSHTLFVQEKDSAGNWSPSASRKLFLAKSGVVGPAGFATGSRASIAVSKSGTPYVAYLTGRDQSANDAGTPVMKKFNGTAWEDIPSTGVTYVNRIQIRLDSSGVPYIAMAYASASAWTFGVFRLVGLDWVSLNAPHLIWWDAEFEFDIGADGTLYVAYKNYAEPREDSSLTFVQYRNGEWSPIGEVLANRGPLSAQFAPNGEAAAAIMDSSTRQISVWTLRGGNWTSHGVAATSEWKTRPWIATNGSGTAVLSYLSGGLGNERFNVIDNSSGRWQPVGKPALLSTAVDLLSGSLAIKFAGTGALFAGWNSIWKMKEGDWEAVGNAFNFKPVSRNQFAISDDGVVYSVLAGEYDGAISVWTSSHNP